MTADPRIELLPVRVEAERDALREFMTTSPAEGCRGATRDLTHEWCARDSIHARIPLSGHECPVDPSLR